MQTLLSKLLFSECGCALGAKLETSKRRSTVSGNISATYPEHDLLVDPATPSAASVVVLGCPAIVYARLSHLVLHLTNDLLLVLNCQSVLHLYCPLL